MSNTFKPTTLDEISRDDIIHKIDTNLFIEAGAGSGKTTMLVNRMVAMVESGKVPVEKICAITFTKNAALEFYERFQAKLIERSDPNNNKEPKRAGDLDTPTDVTRARCLEALKNIDLCFMGTIDSFCNMILSEHPTEANIPSDARLINDKEAAEIYKKFYIDALAGRYGDEIKVLANRFSSLYWNPEDAFATLAKEMMDRRNVNFILTDELCIDFYKCFNKAIKDTRTVLDAFNKDRSEITLQLPYYDKRDPEDVYDSANDKLQKGWNYDYTGVQRAVKDISTLTYDATLEELGLTHDESIVREQAGKVVLNVKDEDSVDALWHKLNNYKYQNSLKLVKLCIQPLEELMRKEGKFTFFDYLFYLRNTLEKDAHNGGKLIDYIYSRHSFFLIDEFQDTNPMQAEVFFYLTAEDPNQKSWKDCVPKPGSLFIVGDPKQSIYRFRSADVFSYLGIKELFNNKKIGEVKYLVNNFRSRNVIKEYFNKVFNEVMPEESPEQSRYKDIDNVSDPEQEELNGIYTYETYSDSLLEDYPDMGDNDRLVKIVKTLVNNPKYIITGKDGELREIKYKDFMIIFYGKDPISSCIAKFSEAKIPVRAEGKVLFEESEGLKLITNIYQTVTDRTNTVSLVASLFGPIFSLTDADLVAYRKQDGKIKLQSIQYGNSEIEKALSKLTALSNTISSQTPSSLYEKIIDDLEIFRYVSSEDLEVIYYTLELIRGEEYGGNIITYEDAVNYMNDLLSGESKLERCLNLKGDIDAVHIANLHKVKGLEAPIVILGKAGSGSKPPKIRIEYKDDENGNRVADGYIISVGNEDSFVSLIETNNYKEQADKEKESLLKEQDRLVYVAATRARNVLIVSEPKMNSKTGPRGMGSKWKPLKEKSQSEFFETIGENSNSNESNAEEEKANNLYKNVKLTKIKLEETYTFKQPSDIQTPSKTSELPYENEGVPIGNGETYATLMGTMVHRLMEMIIMSKDNISKDDTINNILNEYVTEEFMDKLDLFKQKLINVYDVMHNGGFPQKGKAPQDILPIILSADKYYSEVPFTLKDDNNLWNGIIDLIYEKDGKLHIVDWKTNKDDEGLDEHYKSQLDAYKKAVKLTLGQDAEDALIYHIDIK